jgi:hypothetical protein
VFNKKRLQHDHNRLQRLNDQFGSIERVMEGLAHLVHSRCDGIVSPPSLRRALSAADEEDTCA